MSRSVTIFYIYFLNLYSNWSLCKNGKKKSWYWIRRIQSALWSYKISFWSLSAFILLANAVEELHTFWKKWKKFWLRDLLLPMEKNSTLLNLEAKISLNTILSTSKIFKHKLFCLPCIEEKTKQISHSMHKLICQPTFWVGNRKKIYYTY